MRVAILEDDEACSECVAQIMAQCGHQVKEFHDARSLTKALRLDSFDLLLLDWSLPDASGLEVMGWVSDHLEPVPPIIMITARTGDMDIVSGLTHGADDYVVKPFQESVLKARVEALLRRAYPAADKESVEVFGPYAFDTRVRTVSLRESPVRLTTKEFSLALLLFRNLHRPLSRSYISEAVWGHAPDVMSRTLDSHISQIRNHLELRPENGFRLSSVYSFGYRLEEFVTAPGAMVAAAA